MECDFVTELRGEIGYPKHEKPNKEEGYMVLNITAENFQKEVME